MPAPDRLRRTVLPLLLAGMALCAPVRAETTPQDRLDAVEKALGESRARQGEAANAATSLAAELAELRDAAVASARLAQEHEAALTTIDAQLAALAAEEQAKRAALGRDQAGQARLLMALTRLAATPPEDLAVAPGTPVEALRGALLMGRAVPPITAQAGDLKRELAALETLHDDIAATHDRQRGESAGLAAEQAHLAELIAAKAALQEVASRTAEEARQRQVVLAAEAGTLRDLIARLEAERRKQEAERSRPARPEAAVMPPPPGRPDAHGPRQVRPFAQAQGAVLLPVAGAIVLRYGAADEYGVASRGLSFETRPGAEVVAPYDGEVLFAGPFRGYGQILIIGHGDGYHSLLAGLDRLGSSVGQWLVAGEPVGTMPDGAGKPRLYLELRHNNQPINPMPWLATRAEKVNG